MKTEIGTKDRIHRLLDELSSVLYAHAVARCDDKDIHGIVRIMAMQRTIDNMHRAIDVT